MVQLLNRPQHESEEVQERILESVFGLALKRQEELRDAPTVSTTALIETALSSLPKSLPSTGYGDEKAYELVRNHLLPALALGQSGPRFFGLVIGGSLPAAQVGDFLATIYDQNAGMNGGPAYSVHPAIEHRALLMLLELLDLPADVFKGRTLTSGSTAANLLGLACGREQAVRNVLGGDYSVAEEGFGGVNIVVFSDRAHCSLAKGAATIGIGRKNFVQLGDTEEEIEAQLKTCGPGTGRGAIVTLSYGEVNTGEFSVHIEIVRALCDKYNVWLHVDAAFGAFARLSPALKHLAPKLELADSITCDGHKWLNLPYECGIFFSRSAELQASIFGYSPTQEFPAYLNLWKPTEISLKSPGVQEMLSIPQPHELGIESSKRFRAFPLYCALLSLGAAGYRDIIERNVQFARDLAWWMSYGDGKDCYEVLNLFEPTKNKYGGTEMNVPLNIILFRASESCPVKKFRPSSPNSGRELLHAINEDREVFVTPGPNGTLRVAVSNWMTGLGVNKEGLTDLEITVRTLNKIMLV